MRPLIEEPGPQAEKDERATAAGRQKLVELLARLLAQRWAPGVTEMKNPTPAGENQFDTPSGR